MSDTSPQAPTGTPINAAPPAGVFPPMSSAPAAAPAGAAPSGAAPAAAAPTGTPAQVPHFPGQPPAPGQPPMSGQAPGQPSASGQPPMPGQAPGHGGFQVQTFAPSWGASVMGTSAVAIALAIAGGQSPSPVLTWASRIMLLIAMILLVLVAGINVARWLSHRDSAMADLRHPIKGGMTATLSGALLTVAVAVGRVGDGFLPESLIIPIVIALTVLGGALALLIGWAFLGELFVSDGVPMPQVAGTWFIPPVVTIIVPLALLPLVTRYPERAGSLMSIGWMFLGVGTILYFIVTVTLFIRTVNHPLPPAALAPSLVIGMGPAGLIGFDIVRMVDVSAQVGLVSADAVSLAAMPATMFWGFGAWWLVSALVVLRRGYQSIPFTLAWWGFIFPLGAWVIATLVLATVWQATWMKYLGIAALALLVLLWVYVVVRTLQGMRRGTIWAH